MSAERCCFDTSVVMHLLIGAPLAQFRTASRFLEARVEADREVMVGDLVLAEAYFALQSFYGMPKDEALALLSQFSNAAGVAVSEHAREVLATPNLAKAKPGFVDRLIHGAARAEGATLVTFEEPAARLPDTLVFE